jgi:hypothetical protein
VAFYCSCPISEVRCDVNDCCVIDENEINNYSTSFCTNNIYSFINTVQKWPDELHVSISTLGTFCTASV